MVKPSAEIRAATNYARNGWAVFPAHSILENGRCSCGKECASPGKHPQTPNGARDATTDLAAVEKMFSRGPPSNVAVNVGESGLVVIDEDIHRGGRLASLPLSEADLETPTCITGNGGRHVYYRAPLDLEISNSNRDLPDGIDVRAGDGAYVIVPPSRHKSGRRYCWLASRAPWQVRLLPLPFALVKHLRIRNLEQEVSAATPDRPLAMPIDLATDHPYVTAALTAELDRLAQAQPGHRNNSLNSVAFNLGQFVGAGLLDRNQVETLLIQAATNLGLGQSEIQATLSSGLEAGINTPRHNWPDFSQTGGAD